LICLSSWNTDYWVYKHVIILTKIFAKRKKTV